MVWLLPSHEGLPILYTSPKGSGQGCPQLRASNEHSFIVRVLRAMRAPGRSSLILPAAEFLAAPVTLTGASQNVDADVSC